jgi:hypothetical protein
MKQHAFDTVAFVFGLIFLGIGLPMAFSNSSLAVFESRWVLPAVLILAGAVVLATTRKRAASRESVMSETGVDSDFDSMNSY